MKMSLLLSTLFFSLTSMALSPNPNPVIVVKSSGGGLMLGQARERCEVYQNQVVISRRYSYTGAGPLELSEVRKINLKGDLLSLLLNAAKESLFTGDGLYVCDGPSTQITAGDGILLYKSGNCGSKPQYRQGVSSRVLTEIVNMYCPKTN